MLGRFNVHPTPIKGLTVLQRKPIGDSRGYLERLFCQNDFSDLLGGRQIAQINHTLTASQGVIRGMHFQYPPYGETKIVSCLHGSVFDVAVDLRAGSPTFLHWHGEILTGNNYRTLYIPEGFAHGFQTLTPDCEMLYFHTAPYAAEAEGGVNAADPRLRIAWPQAFSERSQRDQGLPFLPDNYQGLVA